MAGNTFRVPWETSGRTKERSELLRKRTKEGGITEAVFQDDSPRVMVLEAVWRQGPACDPLKGPFWPAGVWLGSDSRKR